MNANALQSAMHSQEWLVRSVVQEVGLNWAAATHRGQYKQVGRQSDLPATSRRASSAARSRERQLFGFEI